MKRYLFPLTLLAAVVSLPFCARAQTTYLNETFEDDAIGAVPADTAQRNVSAATTGFLTVIAGSGAIGTSHVVQYNDNSATAGADLEYNVGAAALGALFVQFNIFNNAAGNTGTAANPLIFGVGRFNNTTGTTALGANMNRAFGIEFYQTGATSTLRLRVFGTAVLNATYDMTANQQLKIFANDNDATTLNYVRPDGAGTGVLGINSFVVYLNNALIGTETAAGFTMNTDTTGTGETGDTVGNATLGRLGFNTSTTNTANFLIDNIIASDIPAVPEPSMLAMAALGLLASVASWRHRVRA